MGCLLLVSIQGESGGFLGTRARGTGNRGRIGRILSGAGGQGSIDRIDGEEEKSETSGDQEEFRELDPDGFLSLRSGTINESSL